MKFPPKVICLGEALVDRLGPLGGDPAGTPLDQCDDRLGGAPVNVACALARLGTPSTFIGRLGTDPIGLSLEVLLGSRGVSITGVQHDKLRPTRIVLVKRDTKGERVFQGFVGNSVKGFADQALDRTEVQVSWPALSEHAQWLVVGTIPMATKSSAESLHWVVREAKVRNIRIALDINWRPTFWNETNDPAAGPDADALVAIQPLIAAASLLKLAKEEAMWIFGTTDPNSISAGLSHNPDVVVTDGGNPVKWQMAGASGVLQVSAPTPLVDTTGAGDAFTAGLLHQLVETDAWSVDPERMIRFAAACGALVCSGAGAIDPQPDTAAVLKFLQS